MHTPDPCLNLWHIPEQAIGNLDLLWSSLSFFKLPWPISLFSDMCRHQSDLHPCFLSMQVPNQADIVFSDQWSVSQSLYDLCFLYLGEWNTRLDGQRKLLVLCRCCKFHVDDFMAGMTAVKLGVEHEKNNVAFLKICDCICLDPIKHIICLSWECCAVAQPTLTLYQTAPSPTFLVHAIA